MDIKPTVCYHEGCQERWLHNHMLPLSEVLEFYSYEASGCVRGWLRHKREDSWYEPLKRKIEAEGFFGGVRITVEWSGSGCVRDGHHRLAVCEDRGQYWCPITEYDEIEYDYPDQWGADDYGWKEAASWERSTGL